MKIKQKGESVEIDGQKFKIVHIQLAFFARMIGQSFERVKLLYDQGVLSPPGRSKNPTNPRVEKLLGELMINPEISISQADFARIMDCDRSVISRLCERGVLAEGAVFRLWFNAFCAYRVGHDTGRKASGYF